MSSVDISSSIKSQGNELQWWELTYWRLRMTEFRKDPEATKILMMRITLALFLIAAAAGISISAYSMLQEGQLKSFESDYHSVAENALQSVEESFKRLNSGVLQLSRVYGEVFPDEDTWPNVAWSGYHSVIEPLRTTSSIEGFGVFPLVLPHQVADYNEHTLQYYKSHPEEYDTYFPIRFFPNGSIFMQDNSQLDPTPYEVITGFNPPFKYFTPVLQYTLSALGGENYVGYDMHADPRYVVGLESVMNCTKVNNVTKSLTACAGITEVTPMPWYNLDEPNPVINDMMAAFLHPIFPGKNHSKLVGFAGGTLSWATTLTDIVPTFAHNIDCVVQAHKSWFTFTMVHGTPVFKGFGDLHDEKYSEYKIQSGALSPSLNAADVNSHRLFLYPTREFYDAYCDDSPLHAALVLVAVFVLCALLFYAYDVLMKREFSRRQAVLDTKRRFVRFISHEIRTPLNTVRLGLKLFEDELNRLLEKVDRTPPAELAFVTKTTLNAWKGLTEEILESSDSAVEVLDDLLNYDKIEIGTLRLEFGLFDMRELIKRSAALMQAHATQKGVMLVLQYHSEGAPYDPAHRASASSFPAPASRETPPSASVVGFDDVANVALLEEGRRSSDCAVIGDPTRLSQVLRNLISNALKFTPPKGTVTVTVSTARAVKTIPEKVRQSSHLFQHMNPIGTVSIAVTDSGTGLTNLQLLQICKEGVQFNANELQAGQGSGLGLFISKGIVEQHGGALSVSSEGLGKGATFTIELPLYHGKGTHHLAINDTGAYTKYCAPPTSSAQPEVLLSVSTGTLKTITLKAAASSQSRKILVVDDSPFNRKMLVRLMTSKGFECAQAEDGADAVRVYQEMTENDEVLEFILMDFEMPVMNGPTATRKLRELGCECLIVGVTGNVLPDQVATFKRNGADAVLPKPLVMEDLQFLLDTHNKNSFSQKSQKSIKKRSAGSAKTSIKIVPVGAEGSR